MIEVTDEMLTAAMRAFEPLSSVLRYREKDKWHTCDMMAMREAIKAAMEVASSRTARKLRMIVQHYEGVAVGGPFGGCEIDADGPTVSDGQGGSYNHARGQWHWVAGLGTEIHAALHKEQSSN